MRKNLAIAPIAVLIGLIAVPVIAVCVLWRCAQWLKESLIHDSNQTLCFKCAEAQSNRTRSLVMLYDRQQDGQICNCCGATMASVFIPA